MKVDLGWRRFTPEWGDGSISMELRPLRRGAMLLILPQLDEFNSREGERIYRLTDTYKMQGLAAQVFPDHVRNLAGLDGEGGPMTVADIGEEAALHLLASEIMAQLLRVSRLTADEVKNSAAPAGIDSIKVVQPGTA